MYHNVSYTIIVNIHIYKMRILFTKKYINSFFSYYRPIRTIKIKNKNKDKNNIILQKDDNQYDEYKYYIL